MLRGAEAERYIEDEEAYVWPQNQQKRINLLVLRSILEDMAASKTHRIEMTDAEIESLLQKAGTSVLEPEEVEKLRQLVETLRYITGELEKKRVSVQRLKSMLFGPQSEKMSSHRLKKLLAQGAAAAEALGGQTADPGETGGESKAGGEPDATGKKKPKGHGRRGADQYSGGEHEHVPHPTHRQTTKSPKSTARSTRSSTRCTG